MKKFWQINFIIYLYSILFIFISITDFYFNKNGSLINYYTFNMTLFYPIMFIEWIQFPSSLIAIIFRKAERTKKHLLFLIALIFLNFIKWILWFFAVAGVTTK